MEEKTCIRDDGSNEAKKTEGNDRRGFLLGTLIATTAAITAGLIYPLTRYFFPKASSSSKKSSGATLSLSTLQVGSASFVKINGKPAIVVRRGETDIVSLSAVCTHLGCIVKYRDEILKCPCHGASFDLNGKVLGGPAPSPLARFAVTVDGDVVTINGETAA